MRIALGLVILSSALIPGTSALAATATSEHGEVLVNRGAGYKPVTQPSEVVAGDQILVTPRSRGQVVFPDGCTVNISPGIVFSVPAKSPCERRGSHIETVGSSTPEESAKDDGSYALPSVLAAGMPVGIIVLQDNLKSASP